MTNSLLQSSDIFELRRYEAIPSRIDALHKRMGIDVLPVFARNGVPRPVANWECTSGLGAPLYIYMLRWPDMDARMAAFERFYADAEWKAMYAQGPTINAMDVSFLQPSPSCSLVDAEAEVGDIHEMRLHSLSTANSAQAHEILREREFPFFISEGATLLGGFEVMIGGGAPSAVSFLSWKSYEERSQAMSKWESGEGRGGPKALAFYDKGRALILSTASYLMRSPAYGRPRPGFPRKEHTAP